MGSYTGFISLSGWLQAVKDATNINVETIIIGIGTILLTLTLPSVGLSGFIACRGRNRRGGWLLLAHVILVFLCAFGYWQAFARFIWFGLSPVFLAALLAAFSRPRPSKRLAAAVVGCWLFLVGLGEGPDLIQHQFERAVSTGDVQTANRLLGWGADPQPGGKAIGPLLTAVEGNDADMVRLLINHGASPLQADVLGNSAMTRSIELRHSDITIAMLEQLDAFPSAPSDEARGEP